MGVKKSPQDPAKSKTAVEQQIQSRGPIVRRTSNGQPADGDDQAALQTPAVPREDASGVVCVSPTGDVVLDVKSEHEEEVVSFRASARSLVTHSTYFKRLLEDTRFAEGIAVSAKLEQLRQKYNDLSEARSDELPRVSITDLGRTSSIKSIKPIMTDFLLVLHNGELPTRKIPLTNLTNLAIVADRFDAAAPFAAWIRKRGLLARPKPSTTLTQSEETLRQRLLLGLLLSDADLVQTHSRDLILKGSPYWDDAAKPPPHDALWWDLPLGVEEELQHRRAAILRTIWSLLHACVEAYAATGARQCRLGYDSSLQCDVFQLGQFVRFLARTGFLAFASALAPPDESALPAPRDRDIPTLLAALRACPAYQVDANHAHCGPKKTLVTGLAAIDALLADADIGLCVLCWTNPRNMLRSWTEVTPALDIDVARAVGATGPRAREPPHVHAGEPEAQRPGHAAGLARELFTADAHTWTAAAVEPLARRGAWASISKLANA